MGSYHNLPPGASLLGTPLHLHHTSDGTLPTCDTLTLIEIITCGDVVDGSALRLIQMIWPIMPHWLDSSLIGAEAPLYPR